MAEFLHQLIGSFPIIYRVSYIPGGAGFQPSTVVHVEHGDNVAARQWMGWTAPGFRLLVLEQQICSVLAQPFSRILHVQVTFFH